MPLGFEKREGREILRYIWKRLDSGKKKKKKRREENEMFPLIANGTRREKRE